MQTQPTLLRTNRIALTESRFADMHDVIAGLPKAERTYVAALRHFELTIHGLNLFMERANLRMDTLETTATVVVNGETILIGTPKEEVCGVEERVFPALGVAVALQMDKTTDGSWIGGVRVLPLDREDSDTETVSVSKNVVSMLRPFAGKARWAKIDLVGRDGFFANMIGTNTVASAKNLFGDLCRTMELAAA